MNHHTKLRAKAQQELSKRFSHLNSLDNSELHVVIQELHIHQIELEMQNDELQKTQAELEISRNRYKQLYEFAPVGIFTCNLDGIILVANATLEKLLGVPREDLLDTSFAQFSSPSSRDTYYRHTREVLKSGGEKSCTISLLHHDGKTLLADMKSSLEEVAGNTCIRTSLLDITDRSYAEAHLLLTSSVIDKASEGIIITDAKGLIIYVNTAFCSITGYQVHEVIGKNTNILQSDKQDASFYANMWAQLRKTDQWQGEIWNKKKRGDIYPEYLSISTIRNVDNGVSNYIGLFSDISDKLLLEDQLRQAQKMEAIGTLVGGIAHDFNNMLAGITGNLYLAMLLAKNSPELLEKLNSIETLSMHAAEMIAHMLAFARKGFVQMQTLSLSSLLKEAIPLARIGVPNNINFHKHIDNDALMIEGDVSQLQQVILNLVNNARDALGSVEKPEIQVSLKKFTADMVFRSMYPELDTSHLVHLCIADNGSGISEEDIKLIFDPFFTTKEVGKGTGLGLSMCYGAIKSHHGIIHVDSVVGKGSSFHIYLPLLQENRAVEQVVAQSDDSRQVQGETILFADDEAIVREVVAEILKKTGYRVLLASDGKMALELFEQHQGEVCLAILDVVMPHLDGPTLAERLRQVKPELPILFSTGYDKEHILNYSKPIANSDILTKPFNFNDLTKLVRKLIK